MYAPVANPAETARTCLAGLTRRPCDHGHVVGKRKQFRMSHPCAVLVDDRPFDPITEVDSLFATDEDRSSVELDRRRVCDVAEVLGGVDVLPARPGELEALAGRLPHGLRHRELGRRLPDSAS